MPNLNPVQQLSATDRQRKNFQRLLFIILIILVVAGLGIGAFFSANLINGSTYSGIGVVHEPNNEQIGLSDGSYAFDTGPNRVDVSLKTQAATKFASGDTIGAGSLWGQAVKNDTNDAEALIYLENQWVEDKVHNPGSAYITLIVGTMLSGDASAISTGRDDLQGAYVEQKEYNDGSKLGGKLVRLLIANAGSKQDYATEVAGQIVQAAKQDPTIVGVMGWPYSEYAKAAITVLAAAHIPMVSQTASADNLTGISPYFFRVAPSNKSQAIAGANYAEQQLQTSSVVIFVDPDNSYSRSLAADFKQQLATFDKNQSVNTENYTVGDKASLPEHLQNALKKSKPDLIYFSGYAADLAVLLVDLPTSQPNLQILGGDALYELNGYSNSSKSDFSRLHFTAFAYPDEWGILVMGALPRFFSDYKTYFNHTGADPSEKSYGYTRADNDVILSYDAMFALLQGCQNVLDAKNALTSATLQSGLTQISGAKAIQGLSGQISFGSDGDPIKKAVVILYVDPDGHIHLLQPDGVQGCFRLGECG